MSSIDSPQGHFQIFSFNGKTQILIHPVGGLITKRPYFVSVKSYLNPPKERQIIPQVFYTNNDNDSGENKMCLNPQIFQILKLSLLSLIFE